MQCSKNFSSLRCSTCSTLLQFLCSSRSSLLASIRFLLCRNFSFGVFGVDFSGARKRARVEHLDQGYNGGLLDAKKAR